MKLKKYTIYLLIISFYLVCGIIFGASLIFLPNKTETSIRNTDAANGTLIVRYHSNTSDYVSNMPGNESFDCYEYSASGGYYHYDFYITITSTIPQRNGYIFLGWSRSTSASSTIPPGRVLNSGFGTPEAPPVTYYDDFYAIWGTAYMIDVNILSPSGAQDYASGTMTYYNECSRATYYEQTDQPEDYLAYKKRIIISNIVPTTGMYVESVYSRDKLGTLSNSGGSYTYTLTYTGSPSGDWDDAITIQMQWVKYNIVFNANGGSGSMSSQSFTYNTAQNLPTNLFTREGYKFEGWARSSSGSVVYSDGQSVSNLSTTNGGTVNLYAKWTPIKYKLRYNTNYPSSVTDLTNSTSSYDTKYTYDKEYTINNVPSFTVPTGYSFTGWSTSATAQTGWTKFKNLASKEDTYVDVYAIWKANEYSVKLDNQSATSPGTTSITATYDSHVPTITSPIKTGYTFGGYYTGENGTGTQYITASGTSANIWKETGVTTLYAKWTANKYTVTFDKQGGSGGTDSVTVTYDSPMPEITMPKKEGYVLLSYYFVLDGGNTRYYHANGTSVRNWDLHEGSSGYSSSNPNFILRPAWLQTWAANASTSLTGINGENGKGSKTNPYKIANAKDLAYIAKMVNKGTDFAGEYFVQTSSIDLLNRPWLPIGGHEFDNNGNSFSGNYNGQGYMIKGLRVENYMTIGLWADRIYSKEKQLCNNIGLFGCCQNATLKNINIISGEVYGNTNVGAIVGYIEGGLIENCRNSATVAGINSIGMVGKVNKTQIIACYNYGDIKGTNGVGGLIGNVVGNTADGSPIIKNSLASCRISGETCIAGLVGNSVRDTKIVSSGFNKSLNLLLGGVDNIIYCDCFAIINTSQIFYGRNETTKWTTINGYELPEGLVWMP